MIRVLHVDDSPDDRELNRFQLLRLTKDIEIVEAESVDEALEKLKGESFDCILSDYQMPELSGLDLLTSLRENGNETPFIFLTGQGSEEIAAAALRAGADDYFTKEAGFAHYERLENSLKRVTDAHKARINHRQAIRDLEESEEKYRNLVVRANDLIIIIQDGLIKFANKQMEKLLGYSAVEVLDTPIISYFHPNEIERINDLHRRRLDSGDAPHIYESALVGKDGTRFDVEINAGMIEYQSRPAVLAFVRDISERKRSEEALQKSEAALKEASQFLELTVDAIPEIICVQDADHNVIRYNKAGYEFLGVTPEEAHGRNCYELLGRKTPCEDCATSEVYKTLKPARVVRYMEEIDSWLEIWSYPILNDAGELTHIIEHIRDVTAHKRADEALKASEAKYRALFEDHVAGVFRSTFEGRILEFNPALLRVLGYESFDELLEVNIKSLYVRPEDRPRLISILQADGRVENFEVELYRRDGTTVWVLINALMHDNDVLQGTMIDITRRREVEQEIHRRKNELDSILRAAPIGIGTVIGRIFTNVNHSLCEMTGYSEEELLGKSSRLLYVNDEEFERIGRESDWQFAEHGTGTIESRWRRKDGEIIDVFLGATPIDPNDPSKGMTFTALDFTDRKRAEQALAENEASLRSILLAAPIGIGVTEGRIIKHVNDRLCTMFEYRREEMLERDTRFLYPSDEVYQFVGRERDRQAVSSGTCAIEAPMLRKDGSIIYALISTTPLDPMNPAKGSTFTVLDITDRMRAENSLRESERYYRTLVEAASDAIFILKDYTFVDCNLKTLEMFGCTREEIINMTPYELSPPTQCDGRDSKEKAIELVNTALKGEAVRFEWLHKRSDGTEFDTEVSLKQIEGVGEPLIIALVRDITERKQTEDSLRKSEQTYRTLFEHASDAIILLAPEGIHIDANDKAAAMLGYSREELIGMSSIQVLHPDHHDDMFETVNALLAGETLPAFERKFVTKTGEVLVVEINASVVRDRDDNPQYVLTIVRDVTQRRAVEKALRRSRNQLAAANRELETFSYSVSHDLRAPLRHIKGFVQLLADNSESLSAEDRARFTDNIVTSVQRMEHLIEALLKLSRVTRGELNRSKISLSDIAGDIENNLKSQGDGRSVQFIIEPDLTAEADPDLIRAVLENLFSNAWKFTSDREDAVIQMGSTQANGAHSFFVRDNGIGFDQKEAENIFAPFTRLQSAREIEGTGVGLATVQRIIHRHEGRIWAESELGKGATFYFTLG